MRPEPSDDLVVTWFLPIFDFDGSFKQRLLCHFFVAGIRLVDQDIFADPVLQVGFQLIPACKSADLPIQPGLEIVSKTADSKDVRKFRAQLSADGGVCLVELLRFLTRLPSPEKLLEPCPRF